MIASVLLAISAIGGGAVVASAPASASTCATIPLPAGHWYGPAYTGVGAHDGHLAVDRTEVGVIQLAVRSRGIQITADGYYGEATRAAVSAWQRAAGLAPDGLVGPRTWASMAYYLDARGSGSLMCRR